MSNVLCLDPESLEIGDLIVLNGRAFDVEKHIASDQKSIFNL